MNQTLTTGPTGPTGPQGLPILGSSLEFARDPLGFFEVLQRDFGPLARVQLGPQALYVVNHPELIESLLTGKHRECIKDRFARELQPLAGNGLVTNDGDPWRRQRKLASPPFQPKNIVRYAEIMVECARRACAGFADGGLRQLDADIVALTLEIAGKTLLGFDTQRETARVQRAVTDSIPYFERRLFSVLGLLPRWLPFPSTLRFKAAKRDLDALVLEIIERCRVNEDASDCLLARLIHARDESGRAMSHEQLRDEAITMLLAGHETTAVTISFALYLLARHPAAASRLRLELDAQLGERSISHAELSTLPYLRAVVRETLRLYPAIWAMGREVAVPIELGGHELPRGTQLVTCSYAVQRNPAWFAQPSEFRPERWLDGSTDRLPRFAYFPFGGGPRVCIGSHFAEMEAQLVIATLVQQLELELPADFHMQIKPHMALRSRHGLPMRVSPRARPDHRSAETAQPQPTA